MVEISSSSSSISNFNGSHQFTRISKDQLFSVLLLLPVDSILCFGMTCRRFRSITSSDALWELICRRDWGSACVDSLRSSLIGANWLNLYRRVHLLDSVYCHRLLSSDDTHDVLPNSRASHSFNFVSGFLVLFGGGCEGGENLHYSPLPGFFVSICSSAFPDTLYFKLSTKYNCYFGNLIEESF